MIHYDFTPRKAWVPNTLQCARDIVTQKRHQGISSSTTNRNNKSWDVIKLLKLLKWWPQDTKSGWQSQQPRPGKEKITLGSCCNPETPSCQYRHKMIGIPKQKSALVWCKKDVSFRRNTPTGGVDKMQSVKKRQRYDCHSFLRIFARELGKGFSVWNHILARQVWMSRRKHWVKNVCFCNRGSWAEKVATKLARVEKDIVIFGTFQPYVWEMLQIPSVNRGVIQIVHIKYINITVPLCKSAKYM